jgi:uncharacterized protein YjiS (DUF1127 family)
MVERLGAQAVSDPFHPPPIPETIVDRLLWGMKGGSGDEGWAAAVGSVRGPCRRTIARWIARSRQRRALREIAERNDFHLLKDIGVSQEEAFREADKPFWRP